MDSKERVDGFIKEMKELSIKWNIDLAVAMDYTKDGAIPKIQLVDTLPVEEPKEEKV
jgi:hypothetical protein